MDDYIIVRGKFIRHVFEVVDPDLDILGEYYTLQDAFKAMTYQDCYGIRVKTIIEDKEVIGEVYNSKSDD